MISFRLNEIPPGTSEEQLTLKAEELEIEHSGVNYVQLHLKFQKQEEHLRIECRITSDASFICDRSLDTFDTTLNSHYEMVFQRNIREEQEDVSGSLRRLELSQNVIDITKEVRDTILLSIPVKKLHPRFYEKDGDISEFEASFGGQPDENDPRWHKLKKLKQNVQKN